ncbi:MAG: hypothetical protein HKL80_05235 [Acidimicrobiales bacterium]|nr:hypothetical protein [Acidimicrobiales bacterium]
MKIRLIRSAIFAILAIAFLSIGSKEVFAATTTSTSSGYPGPTTSTTLGPNTMVIQQGSFTSGKVINIQSSGYAPGSTVAITLNGVSLGTAVADASGTVTETITVDTVTSTGGTVSINGKTYNVSLTNNNLTVVGSAPNSTQLTVQNIFGLTSSSGGLAFTGINVLRWSIVIVALLVIGGGLIVFERRRSSRNA